MGRTQAIRLRARRAVGPLNDDDRRLARMSRALGHPARVAILRRLLAAGECVCGEIVDLLPLAQATVSQHLKALREAGWIEGETRGTRICYGVAPGAWERFERLWNQLVTKKETSR